MESHLRMGGDKIPELMELASGFDLLQTWCNQLYYGYVNWSAIPEITTENVDRYAAIRFFVAKDDMVGHIVEKTSLDWVKHYPDVNECCVYLKAGDLIPKNTDSFSRLGHIVVSGKTYESANLLADQLVRHDVIIEKT